MLAEAERLGLDLDGVTKALVDDGVKQFADAADGLYGAVADKRIKALGDRLNGQAFSLPEDLKASLEILGETARAGAWSRRLWSGDASLWTNKDEAKWLGWLGAAKGEAIDLAKLDDLKNQVEAGGFTHVLLLGMGGSSLGPEVLGDVCDRAKGSPTLLVLDSTDPTQIARFEGLIDPARTLFVVSSKSGTTLEPDILQRYFYRGCLKGGRRGQGRQPFCRGDRSGLTPGTDGKVREIPAPVPWRSGHWRAFLGAFQLRHGPGDRGRRRCGRLHGRDPGHGPHLRPQRARQRPIPASSWV